MLVNIIDAVVTMSGLEYGKTPYTYWRDDEPNDINRLIELAKPMIRLNFKISIALADIAMTICQQDQLEFDNWFSLVNLV